MKTLFNVTKERGIVLVLVLFLSTTLGDLSTNGPSVAVFNGEQYLVQGHLFSSMMGENLANYEYFPLPSLNAQDGHYRLRLSNETSNPSYLDFAQLLVVQHPQRFTALIDQRGKIHLIGKTQKPLNANGSNGADFSALLTDKDQQVFAFDQEDLARNAITLKFKKPDRTERGKIVLHAQSTKWMEKILDQYYHKFGQDFPAWLKSQNELSSPERLQNIRANDLPLSIYLKREGTWELLEYFLPNDPAQGRDLVIPLNLMTLKETEIELKIETGFMFWTLDYAAMDFSPNGQAIPVFVQPRTAIDQDKNNQLALLDNVDLNYCALKQPGNYLELQYPEVPAASIGSVQTYFLFAKGYFEPNPHFNGLPENAELERLQQPGALADFSRAEFLKSKAQPKSSSM